MIAIFHDFFDFLDDFTTPPPPPQSPALSCYASDSFCMFGYFFQLCKIPFSTTREPYNRIKEDNTLHYRNIKQTQNRPIHMKGLYFS